MEQILNRVLDLSPLAKKYAILKIATGKVLNLPEFNDDHSRNELFDASLFYFERRLDSERSNVSFA